MNLLLTGATGFLGFRTIEKLVLDHSINQIKANGRSIRESHFISDPKVQYCLGNLSDPELTDDLVKGSDMVVHAAALSSPWGKYQDFYDSNILSMKNLVEAAKRHAVKRFIYISTPSIYFNSRDRYNVKESDPLPVKFVNNYAKTKYEAELLLQKSGLPCIILRPRALIGRGDTVIMPRLIRAYTEGRLKIIGSGKNKVDLTSVENVVHAIQLSLNAGENGLNRVYNITNDEPVFLWDSIADILKKMDYPPPVKKVPYRLVNAVARFLELKSKMTNGKEPAITSYGAGTLAMNFTLDISNAKENLGYSPLVNTQQAIDEFVTWYKKTK